MVLMEQFIASSTWQCRNPRTMPTFVICGLCDIFKTTTSLYVATLNVAPRDAFTLALSAYTTCTDGGIGTGSFFP